MADNENSKEKLNNEFDMESDGLTIPEINGTGLISLMHTGSGLASPFMKEIYLRKQAIVGTRFLGGSDELVEDLEVGTRITFLREPDNAFDPDAVMALDEQGRKLGYMPRRDNGLVAALMAAGKYFYGVITEKPEETNLFGSRTPGSIYVDLYMKEFAMPDDLSEIPLQGYRGSYAIMDLELASFEEEDIEKTADLIKEKKEQIISKVYAIKVIHGEEKGCFYRSYLPEVKQDRSEAAGNHSDMPAGVDYTADVTSDYEGMIADLDHFIGRLPLVFHDITKDHLSFLQETYGTILGKTFSNHIIDTMQMAENHIPFQKDYSLSGLAKHLGINIHLDDPGEERCRTIWQLYRRMERSELEKKPSTTQGQAEGTLGIEIGEEKDETENPVDTPLVDIAMTEAARRILLFNGIDTIRELSRSSAEEVRHLQYMTKEIFEELKAILSCRDLSFRPEDKPACIYGYPDYINRIIEEKRDYWEQMLFYEVLAVNLKWLEQFSQLRNRELLPVISDREFVLLDDVTSLTRFAMKEFNTIRGFTREISEAVNTYLSSAMGKPGEAGDPQYIVLVAENLIKTYKSVIHWLEEMRYIKTEADVQEGMKEFIGYGDDILEVFDELHQQAIHFTEMVRNYHAGECKEDDISEETIITINFKEGRIDKLLDIIQKKIQERS